MFIKISNLSEGVHQFEFENNVEKIDIVDPYFNGFKTKVVLNQLHNQIILEAVTTLKAKFECDRCCTEFEKDITSSYTMVYLTDEPVDNSDENVTYIAPDTVRIDISKDVRDFALLSVPMKKLCIEECKGLCFRCGADLNSEKCNCDEEEIDPRWKPLLDLNKKLNNN